MDVYNVIYNEGEDKGVFAISLVESPAMEGLFIALKEDEKVEPFQTKLSTIDEEQRLLIGLAMQPDKLIYRKSDDKEFYITFSKDQIKKGAHAFLTNHFNNNSSLEHEQPISGVSVVESWIIEDSDNDKSNLYGFDYPVGSWMISMKVESDEIWNDYVKNGKVKGFSIDGLFSLEKIELKEDKNMDVIEELKKGFTELKAMLTKEIKLGTHTIGDKAIYFEGEEIAVDTLVFSDEEMTIPFENGDHEIDNGKTIVVLDGKVTEIKDKVEADESNEEVEASTEPTQLSSNIVEVNKWQMMVSNDTFNVGEVVYRVSEFDGEQTYNVGAGEFQLADGSTIITDAGGVIVATKGKSEVDTEQVELSNQLTQLKSDVETYKADLNKQLADKEKEIEDLKTQLSTTPSTKPIAHTPINLNTVVTGDTPKERIFNLLKNK